MRPHTGNARGNPLLLALVALTGLLPIMGLHANTCIWGGGVSGAWSVAANWNNCSAGAPVNGDALQFPQSAANKNTAHDLDALTQVAGIAFTGSTSGYLLAGNALGIGAGGISNSNTSGSNQIDMDLTLTSAQSFSSSTGAMLLSSGQDTVNSGLHLGGNNLLVSWSNVNAVAPWTIDSVIRGSGNITVAGTSSANGLVLQGDNTFSGTFTLQSGRMRLDHTHALGVADGTVGNGTSIAANATMALSTNLSVGNEALSLPNGSGQNGNGLLQYSGTGFWGGPVQLSGAGTSRIISLVSGSLLTFSGPISGSGGFELGANSAAAVKLGNSDNNFVGVLTTSNSSPTQGGTLRLGADNAIAAASTVLLRGNSTFDLNGFDASIGSLTCTATDAVAIAFGSSLTVGSNNASTSCAATISGSFSNAPFTALTKIGSGVLTLSGESSFPGEVDVLGGGLEVNGGLIPDVQTAIFVSSGQNATLFGNGVVGNVVSSGHVHGGSLATPGTLTTGFLSFPALGKITARLADVSGYDQLNVSNLSLNANTVLVVLTTFSPPPGSAFTLINNLGVSAITGQFAGLPEGAHLVANETVFTISYLSGSGNDVVLTVVDPLLFAAGFE